MWRGAHAKVDFLARAVFCEGLTLQRSVHEGLHAFKEDREKDSK